MTLRVRGYLVEDEEQRRLRSTPISDDHRLPNAHKLIPKSRMDNVPYSGQAKVVVYRGLGPGDKSELRPGDWVAIDRKYAKRLRGGRVIKKTVLAKDVSWAGTDETEWFYTPKR